MGQGWTARHGMTADQYQVEFDTLSKQGYRLRLVNGYAVNGQALYAAIWDQTSGPAQVARHGMTADQYQAAFDSLLKQGYRLRLVDGYGVNGQALYAAIWEQASGPEWVARHGMTNDQYQAEFDSLSKKGYRLRVVSGYGVNGQALYAAIWEQAGGPAWTARHGMTAAQYQAEFDTLLKQGYRLRLVDGYDVNGQTFYAALWEQAGGPGWVARHAMTSDQYQAEFDQLADQGYRLEWVSGSGSGGAHYAAFWQTDAISDAQLAQIDAKIQAYVKQQSIPGLSIAVTKQERLVFAKGYGYADTATKEPVSPDSLFRIASISKPVTAIALMELVEAGKVHLDDKVFGPGAILGTTYGSKPYAPNVESITVRHLASHTSGWSDSTAGDPMFLHYEMNQAQLIGWVLDAVPLAHPPGTHYDYLNFGFCVLGRVIEKVSGQPYEDFVKQAVLSRCGIRRMQIGAETPAAKAFREVTYYGVNPYGLLTHRMDAHGGWIASPIDLLRLAVRVDGFTQKADILKPADETRMYTGSTANTGYGLGWILEGADRAHNGGMDGTIGFLVRRNDGLSYAVLCNTNPGGDGLAWNLKALLDSFLPTQTWPGYDLF